MAQHINSDMATESTALLSITIISYIIGAITLSAIATVVAIIAGLSTIAYNVYRLVKEINAKK